MRPLSILAFDQDDFLRTLRPVMDVADGLLVQLYEALRVEEQTLAANEPKVCSGAVSLFFPAAAFSRGRSFLFSSSACLLA